MRRCNGLQRDLTLISFTMLEVEMFISKEKPPRAVGNDAISMLMLKKLETVGLSFLTRVLELSIPNLVFPDIWKEIRIIPSLRLDKLATKK